MCIAQTYVPQGVGVQIPPGPLNTLVLELADIRDSRSLVCKDVQVRGLPRVQIIHPARMVKLAAHACLRNRCRKAWGFEALSGYILISAVVRAV